MSRAFNRGRSVAVALLVVGLGSLVLAPSSSADVTAYPEPAFTRTSANNAYWFHWTAVTGSQNGADDYRYYLCLSTYHNNVQEEFSNGTNGPGSLNCTTSLRNGPTPASGDIGFTPYATGTVLQDGHQYTMCASGYRRYEVVWSSDLAGCAASIIDRNKPALGVSLANGADLTNNPTVPVAISYVDATSPPWNGSNGYASNWVCIGQGGSCAPGGPPDRNCSAPIGGFSSRINSFACAMSISAGDGRYYFCAAGADAAVPDNPNGPNQFEFAFSNNANVSDVACDSVILDRLGPSVSVTTTSTTVTVGQLVEFGMSASDPNGLSGPATWDFGDNTPGATGATATHTYTQAGTYVVKATQSDAAGNPGTGTRTITVKAASTGGSQEGTSGATPITGAMTTSDLIDRVGHQAGDGGARTVRVGALKIIVPKRFVAGKRTMLVAVRASTAGSVTLAFLRGSKALVRKSASLGGPGTYTIRLKMPRKLPAGTYVLRVTYRATGAAKATTKTVKITVRRRTKRSGVVAVARRPLRGTSATVVEPRSAAGAVISTRERRSARRRAQ
jgi:plastocyanin